MKKLIEWTSNLADDTYLFDGLGEDFHFYRPQRNPDFAGTQHHLVAYVQALSKDTNVQLETGEMQSFFKGTRFLALHLDSDPVDIRNGQKTLVAQTMRAQIADFQQLSYALRKGKRFSAMQFIFGITNPRMAKFCENKLGFIKVTNHPKAWIHTIGGRHLALYSDKQRLANALETTLQRISQIK